MFHVRLGLGLSQTAALNGSCLAGKQNRGKAGVGGEREGYDITWGRTGVFTPPSALVIEPDELIIDYEINNPEWRQGLELNTPDGSVGWNLPAAFYLPGFDQVHRALPGLESRPRNFEPPESTSGVSNMPSFLLLGLVLRSGGLAYATPAEALRLLAQPGHVLLLRHANAPGVGDPPGMVLGDCTT